MKSAWITFAAGLCLLIPAWIGLFPAYGPTVLSPLPALTVLSAMAGLAYGAVAVPSLLFFVWNPGLFRGDAKVPKRAYWPPGTGIILNASLFVVRWKRGVQYPRVRYTYIF